MKHLLLALLFTIIGCCSVAANDAVFRPHIQWIVDHSSLEYNNQPLPTIRYVDPQQMAIIAYGEETVARAANRGVSLPGIEALYDHERVEIILPNTVDITDWNIQHILVHELVHYLQHVNGYFELPEYVSCRVGLEELAYDLHTAWMDEVDHPADRPDQLFVRMLVNSCHSVHS